MTTYEVRAVSGLRLHRLYKGQSGARAITARLCAADTLVVANATADVQTLVNGKLVHVKHVSDGHVENIDVVKQTIS